MMRPKKDAPAALFYEFSLEDHVPADLLLRSVDRFVELDRICAHVALLYNAAGRPIAGSAGWS